MKHLHYILTALLLTACANDPLPKPRGFLSLNYPNPTYKAALSDCPYTFNINSLSNEYFDNNCNAKIKYPMMDAVLYLTYRKVDHNIKTLLKDAQKLTYEHVRKADDIKEKMFLNPQKNTYGMFYDVYGNAASQTQFYVTDSLNHFLTGSIYFNAKPNYDSIYPGVAYLKKDIKNLMESIEWQSK